MYLSDIFQNIVSLFKIKASSEARDLIKFSSAVHPCTTDIFNIFNMFSHIFKDHFNF